MRLTESRLRQSILIDGESGEGGQRRDAILLVAFILRGESVADTPSYLHNVRQWLCSPSIGRMTDKQYRCYHLLLNYSWLEEPRATLPNDDIELARLLRLSEAEWNSIKAPILAKFISDGNGRIFNERLMSESDFCASRVAGGVARAKQRASTSAARSKHKRSIPVRKK